MCVYIEESGEAVAPSKPDSVAVAQSRSFEVTAADPQTEEPASSSLPAPIPAGAPPAPPKYRCGLLHGLSNFNNTPNFWLKAVL